MQRREFLRSSTAALLLSAWPHAHAAPAPSRYWQDVFAHMPPALAVLVSMPEHMVQLRCIRIARSVDGNLKLHTEDHGLAPRRWFSPASVAKLPMALLTAERLSQHGLDEHASIRLSAPPGTGEWPADEPLQEPSARGMQRTFRGQRQRALQPLVRILGVDALHERLAQLGYRMRD